MEPQFIDGKWFIVSEEGDYIPAVTTNEPDCLYGAY